LAVVIARVEEASLSWQTGVESIAPLIRRKVEGKEVLFLHRLRYEQTIWRNDVRGRIVLKRGIGKGILTHGIGCAAGPQK